ncbi:hypothetical protein [Bradyrhizobium sp.]|uniref:hypothetical protein n=1 Tax=Bradyrhizobium sp. TaxID=376 RepID=UPI003C7EC8D3
MGVFIDHLVSEFNNTGVLASGTGAIVTLGNSVIQGNGNGVFQTGGGAPANVLHGAVRLHGLTSSPTPDTQVRVAWAYAPVGSATTIAKHEAENQARSFDMSISCSKKREIQELGK